MSRTKRALAVLGIVAAASGIGAAAAHTGHGGYEHTDTAWPSCFEDSVVVLVVSKWSNSNQVAVRPAVSCAAVDDLYLP